MTTWTERLLEFNKSQLEKNESDRLNMKFELQMVQYIMNIISPLMQFKIKDKELKIFHNGKEINKNQFMYWWQIDRYNEIGKEEKQIKKKVNEINEKINKLKGAFPQINDTDDENMKEKKLKKTMDINEKLKKLSEYIKKDEPIVKMKLSLLINFKNIHVTLLSLNNLLENIKIYLENQ